MKRQAKVTSGGRVTVPQEIRQRSGVHAGDKLEFEDNGNGVWVKAVRSGNIFEEYRGIGNPGIGKGRKAINKWLREFRGQEAYFRERATCGNVRKALKILANPRLADSLLLLPAFCFLSAILVLRGVHAGHSAAAIH